MRGPWRAAVAMVVIVSFGWSLPGCDSAGGDPAGSDDFRVILTKRSVCEGTSLVEIADGAITSTEYDSLRGHEDCVLRARDCDEYAACRGFRRGCEFEGESGDASSSWCLDETRLRYCDLMDGVLLQKDFDCDTTCAWGECRWPRCDTAQTACVGDRIESCGPISYSARDCGAVGWRCIEFDDRHACLPPDVTVEEYLLDDHCASPTRILRKGEGTAGYEDIDCTWYGPDFACVQDAEGLRCADGQAPECAEGETRCEGSVAKICVLGKLESIDCSTFLSAVCTRGGTSSIRCQSAAWQ